jgi:hypothetical protein
MNEDHFWILAAILGVIAYLLERLEKRLVDIYRLLKLGKDSD